ncbi:hypothetical protein nbrc107696_15100 [Gordonia spumicola]|uniref:DUF559 domain-containing protein n=1 Tax=Gordonia spumicola TaxID=589161 RepID=A0A7I9V759_9ACTN|nr:hypothetical protein [Gordonia spumicola]GEE01064.1 hypothetical protein nbrc107696_15100 [Gordonia spumicola]
MRVYPGVYITHAGPIGWRQRAWAAVLDAAPAAVSHESALRAHRGDGQVGDGAPIHIAVCAHRKVTRRPGVVVHRRATFAEDVQAVSLPRIRLEEAILDVASSARTVVAAVGCLSEWIGGRRTTADRLIGALSRRARIPQRALIHDLLGDLRDGACSVLEHSYFLNVERAHGLPTPVRQSPTEAGRHGFRDLTYPQWGLVIELDGRAFHDSPADRDRDMERDLDAAVDGGLATLRAGWGQGCVRPCQTAVKVGRLLNRLGWTDRAHPCGKPDCAARFQV